MINIGDSKSEQAGTELANLINKNNLKHVLVFSDGGLVNGSDLMIGMNSVFNDEIMVTGGLAGDGSKFEKNGCRVK